VLAVPVAPADTIEDMQRVYDVVVCLWQPQPFWAVGAHYVDFTQVRDEEVVAMLRG
jgi:putative phosphoribosyl transferase